MDTPQSPFSCYLIGTESLLIQCAQALLARGHRIRGIVTSDGQIRGWAEAQGVPVIDPHVDLEAALSGEPFEYLFSIANLAVVPGPVVRLARRAAINFHDGPLPRYAGLHATSWALLNQEASHGVSWHLMLEDVDRGDLLVERTVAIAEGETAFTLNAKCYEAGMESFVELIDALASGRAKRRAQEAAGRTYFGRYQRPPAGGVIAWQRPAGEIAALVRALDFGPYPNAFCAAKLLLPGGAVAVVGEAGATAAAVAAPTHAAPAGTVLAVEPGALRVAAGSGEVRLGRLRTPEGQPLDPAALGLRGGDRLPVLDQATAERLRALYESLARHEGFWLRRLGEVEPLTLPDLGTPEEGTGDWDELLLPVPPSLADLAHEANMGAADLLLCAAAAWLGRMADRGRFHLAYRDPALAAALAGGEPCFAGWVPLRVDLPEGEGVLSVARRMGTELHEVRRRVSYARDLVGRHPQLLAAAGRQGPLRIAVEIGADGAPPPGCALVLRLREDGSGAALRFDRRALSDEAARALARQSAALLRAAADGPSRPLGELPLLEPAERHRLLEEWNDTTRPVPQDLCVHEAFGAQARRTPEATALTFEDRSLSYAALEARANQLAHRLQALGVGPDSLVGICLERSLEMVVAVLGVLKAGGAYVPLDPAYPAERLAYMMEDAGLSALLTQQHLVARLPAPRCPRLCLDDASQDRAAIDRCPETPPRDSSRPEHLAYVIYTSGSTGRPKGVMVEHRNVINFFAGMDEHLSMPRGADAPPGGRPGERPGALVPGPQEPPGVWLAVTSLSFDISVLELLWTLCRGFHVVVQRDSSQELSPVEARRRAARPIDFSLFYFASDEGGESAQDKYRLLLESARFADRHGFAAVWTPERHFHAFGGLYPNPSVVSAALAVVTERVRLRAGSCVLPLHDPIRVAEEWAVVDNLSRGRVDIAFASGWQPNDFVLAPHNYADRKRSMIAAIDVVRRLWRGEAITRKGADGKEVTIRTLPRPVQRELPIWLTAAANPETFQLAGELGASVLTHLLGQSFAEVADKCALYRRAFRESGHQGRGHVTLMLHTFVGPDLEAVKRTVREPMKAYLRSAVALVKEAAWTFPTFKQRAEQSGRTPAEMFDAQDLSPEDLDALLGHAFDRYFDRSGLFGTPESCQAIIDQVRDTDVDEVACLIDYGVPAEAVLRHLPYLAEVRERAGRAFSSSSGDYSIGAQMERHGVTHLQCTPSMMGMILLDDRARAALPRLRALLLGGEPLPQALLGQLRGEVGGFILNVYGPTETTIWSTAGRVDVEEGVITIGRPLANTQIYLLDRRGQPVPLGAAGELCIGGAGVARGYLGQPDLTAERFVPNPFRPGERLYRTGDLARYTPDGRIIFLGRGDHQVKIRGYRIELGEIEAALAGAEEVAEAVVVAREDTPGDKRLCAYVTARPGRTLRTDELRERLARSLPPYMVPAHVVVLPAMPLTPNAKIDRRALPPPAQAQATPSAPPESELERTIAAIWQELLDVPRVGLDDNFFDLGGHSLLTVQAHRRVREATGRDLAITDMFRFPTIRSLAAFLSEQPGGEDRLAQSESRAEARRGAMARRQQLRQRRDREGEP